METYLDSPIVTPAMQFDGRSNQVSRRDDNIKDVSVGVKDIDSAIMYYLTEVVKPVVMSNDKEVAVPVIYANSEQWKAMQVDGKFRDRDGKRQFPVITIKRTSLERNRDITTKLDANNPHNYYVTRQFYSSRNRYDRFMAANGRIPQEVLTYTIVPDYVNLEYSCTIYTDYMSQMNPIIEAINFASDSYWGPKDRFKFQSFIDSFKTETVMDGDVRYIKTDFGIKLRGYIIPDSVNAGKFTNVKRYNKTKTVVTMKEGIISGDIWNTGDVIL